MCADTSSFSRWVAWDIPLLREVLEQMAFVFSQGDGKETILQGGGGAWA